MKNPPNRSLIKSSAARIPHRDFHRPHVVVVGRQDAVSCFQYLGIAVG